MPSISLHDAAAEVMRRAEAVDLRSLNEANTKALFIEPMLSALGWDVMDLDTVTREYRVFDNTLLDYALLVAKRPSLFCEAKPAGRSLDDPKWIAQTINYANNQGVVWCVLTDGLRWKVFKANEAAPMEKKQAFEVKVADLLDPQTSDQAIRLFFCLTPGAVADGALNRLGTQIFVDGRVRATLIGLLEDPPNRLVDLLRSSMGNDHGLKPADVRGALARVVGPAIAALGSELPLPTAAPAPQQLAPAPLALEDAPSVDARAGDELTLKRKGEIVARGRLTADGGVVLLPGTLISKTEASYAGKIIRQTRQQLLEAGSLTERDAEWWLLTDECACPSSSTAAGVVTGLETRGPHVWRDANNVRLSELTRTTGLPDAERTAVANATVPRSVQ